MLNIVDQQNRIMNSKILIIEDNEAVSRFMAHIMRTEGYMVEVAFTGSKGIELLAANHYNLIVLDIVLPDMNGAEILHYIRKDYSPETLPVIITSSITEEQKIASYLQKGVNDFLTKPFSKLILTTKVSNLLKLQISTTKLKRNNEVLQNIINNIPILSVIVSDDLRVIYTNEAFAQQFDTHKQLINQELLGNVIHCVNSVESHGQCGKTTKCPSCIIRNSVKETIANGKNVYKRSGCFNILIEGNVSELSLQVSTTKILYDDNPGILLNINDITNEKTYQQALKDSRDEYQAQAEELARLLDDLKNTSDRLAQSESRYRLIADYGNDWEVFRDKNNRLIYCSPAVERVIGYTVEEYTHKVTFADFIHQDDLDRIISELNKLLKGEIGNTSVFRAIKKTGENIWIETSGQPVYSSTGELLGFRTSSRDITKLKVTEFALQESRSRYKLISDYSVAWETYRRYDGKLLYCSPGIERLLGFTAEEYTKTDKLLNIIYHEDKPVFEKTYARMLAGESVDSAIYRLIKKNGDIIWADIAGQPVHSETGDFMGFRVSVRDITLLKEQEDQIKWNNERLESLQRITHFKTESFQEFLDFALSEALMLTKSKIGYIYYYNEKTQRFTLNTRSKEVMKECSVEMPQTEYDLDKTGIWGEAVRKRQPMVVNDFKAFHPLRKGTPDGHVPIRNFLSIPVSINDEIVAIVGVANKQENYNSTDITQLELLMNSTWKIIENKRMNIALKESEARYRLISDYSTDWEIYRDEKGKLVYCSPAVERVLGYTVEEFMQEMPYEKYIHPDDIEVVITNIQRLINREKLSGGIYRFIKKNGSLIYLDVHAQSVITNDGQFRGFRLSGRDITEKILLEQQLRELNATKDKFFSIISHDLRSPMSSLLGFSELLYQNEELSGQKRKQYIGYVYNIARNTYNLLENLLTWARSQSGHMEFHPARLNLKEKSDEIFTIFQSDAQRKKIDLINSITNDIDVIADENMLNMVLRNLITNAIKFTNTDGCITIGAESGDRSVEICVSDTGVGMSEEIKSTLFKTGLINSQPGTRNEKGTGLGLVLCKDFIEKHGGKIWVKSEPGIGSVIKFTLEKGV